MSRSALRPCRQQLLTAFRPRQLSCATGYATEVKREELAQRLAELERAGVLVYRTLAFLIGANLLNKYWMPTSLSLQRK